MSTLKADTIQSTGGGAATLTKQHAAKAWGRYSHSNTAFEDSFNFSSASDQGTGDARLTFSSAMVNNDFSCTTSASNNNERICVFNEPSTTTVDVEVFTLTGNTDATQCVNIHGDLA